MTTLAADKLRTYHFSGDPVTSEYPVIAADIIYRGAAVGENGSGYSRPLVALDPFQGFAEAKADNAAGAAGDKTVFVRQKGSHMILQRRAGGSTITVPVPDHREMKTGTLMSIIRQSQLSRSLFESN